MNFFTWMFLLHTFTSSYGDKLFREDVTNVETCLTKEIKEKVHRCPHKPLTHKYNNTEAQIIVDFHNSVRRNIKQDKTMIGSHENSAANMVKMMWDETLAELALKRLRETCPHKKYECELNSNPAFGQTYFSSNESSIESAFVKLKQSNIDKLYPPSFFTYQENVNTEEYTHMVWHSTHYIGCGEADYDNQTHIICNYVPSKVYDESHFIYGPPCSHCPPLYVCEARLCVPGSETGVKVEKGDQSEIGGGKVTPQPLGVYDNEEAEVELNKSEYLTYDILLVSVALLGSYLLELFSIGKLKIGKF